MNSVNGSDKDYYGYSSNNNMYIINNANPFLVTPYTPNTSQCNTCNPSPTDIIISSDPLSITVSVESNIDIAYPYILTVNGNTSYTDRIYTGGQTSGLGPGVSTQEIGTVVPLPTVETTIDGSIVEIISQQGQTTFTDGTSPGAGAYICSINGMLQLQPQPVSGLFPTAAGFLPVQVGTPPQTYYIPLYGP